MKHYGTPEEVSVALEQQLSKWHLFFEFDTTHAHTDEADCVCERMNNYALRLAFYWRDIGILLEKYEASEKHSQANAESRYLERCGEILEEMETEGQRFVNHWGERIKMMLASSNPRIDYPRIVSFQGQSR